MSVVDGRLLAGAVQMLKSDVCLVGAGAAGLYLGTRLARAGLDVVVLEAGGHTAGEVPADSFAFEGDPYRGATEGRFFGLGGTTARWGGMLVPHSASDLRPSAEGFDPWRYVVDMVARHRTGVLHALGIGDADDDESLVRRTLGCSWEPLEHSGLHVVVGRILPWRSKNFVSLLRQAHQYRGSIKVVTNAAASRWQFSADADGRRRIESVWASFEGKELRIDSRSFVVTAGAIESARILLEIEAQAGTDLFSPEAAVGCFLGDHLSCVIAQVSAEDRPRAIRLFAPRFARHQMRNFRFVEKAPPGNSARSFAHFVFGTQGPGFRLAKQVLASVQSRKRPDISASLVAAGSKELARLAWDRIARRRLHIPGGAPTVLQLDVEQVPHRSNRVRLQNKRDRTGRLVAAISWSIRPVDEAEIAAAARRFLAAWPGGNHGLPRLDRIDERASGAKPHDAYHPVGTCRLGTSAASVVDTKLGVHGFQNLAVLSTGVLPSAGTANPTFTMLCLAEMLAERLSREACH